MRNKYLIVPLLMALCPLKTGAQTPQNEYRLTIHEMFALADSNNSSIRAHKTAVEEAVEAVKVAKNAWLPSIDAQVSVSYNGDGVITDRNFSNSFVAEIPPFGNNIALEVSQVLFAGGAIKHGVKISELQSQLAALRAEGNRQDVRFLLVGNYLELCRLNNQLHVFDSNISQTEKVLENMRSRYEEGTALSNDITRYELRLQNLKYQRIQLQNTVLILNNQMITALGLPKDAVIVPDEGVVGTAADPRTNDYWQNTALSSSFALKSAEAGIKISESAEKITRAERLPQIAFTAADYLNGPVTIEIPALNKNFNYWFVGVGVRYSFGNLYKSNKKLRANELATRHAQQQKVVLQEQIETAVDAAYIRFNEAYSLLETKEKSLALAQQNYDVVSYRYENDLALITDLLDASSQKLDAELQVINAQINIEYNFYKLKHISGTL